MSHISQTKHKSACAIVELRQYMLHPGKRDELIDLFDREFVEPQEAVGMTVMGQFRDLDDPDRFIWLRGFRDMQTRAKGLAAFYGGPVWQKHRGGAANTTMIDSDNVLLLCPAWPGSEIGVDIRQRDISNKGKASGLLDASIFYLKESASADLLKFCREHMQTALIEQGARQVAWYVTEPSPNNFPKLPVRENEIVLVGFAMFDDAASFEKFSRGGKWDRKIAPILSPWLSRATELHRLTPTTRSAIRA